MSLHAVALTPEEKDRILAICGRRALLVGGQSLAVWAAYYGVTAVGVLSQAVTTDVDYLGSAEVARELSEALGPPWQVRVAGWQDAGPQVAKVFARVEGDGLKQVDFLESVAGLDTDRIRRRSVEIELSGARILSLMHPLDVLESRLSNLAEIPDKRDAFGVEQARLAIRVARAFILSHLDRGTPPRVVFHAAKNIRRLALDSRYIAVAVEFGIDVLDAFPSERILAPKFTEVMWPRLVAAVERKRATYEARVNSIGRRRDVR